MTASERVTAITPAVAMATAESQARRHYADAVDSKIRDINNQLSINRTYPYAFYLCQHNEQAPFVHDVAEPFRKAGWLVTVQAKGQGNVYLVFDVPGSVGWTVPVTADTCAACGHARVFHQVGRGTGVPAGKYYCDDRHSAPCSCTGFFIVTPYSLPFTVTREELYGLPPKDRIMQLKDFKPGDLVSFRANSVTDRWHEGVVDSRCERQKGYAVTCATTHEVAFDRTMHTYDNEGDVGLLVKRRYLYAIGEEVQGMPWTGAPWQDGKVSAYPSDEHCGVYVVGRTGAPVFYRYTLLRKKPVETEQDRLDKVTKPLHQEIASLKKDVERWRIAAIEADNNLTVARRDRDYARSTLDQVRAQNAAACVALGVK